MEKTTKEIYEDGVDELDICFGNEGEDTGYLSDTSELEEFPKRRGRKRKEMSPEDSENKRVTANFQERERMNKLNKALDNLRHCLPDQFKLGNRRISKFRTLRLAASYIKSLGDILKEDFVIRDSIPPHPGFQTMVPGITDVNRQGDGGEIYTPEKDLCFNQSPESVNPGAYDHRLFPMGFHPLNGASPSFPGSGHLPSQSFMMAYPHLPPYLPMYPPPPHFCPPGYQPLLSSHPEGTMMHPF